MEKGARSVECGVSDKATSAVERDVGLGLGLKLQTTQTPQMNVTDGGDHDVRHHHRPSSSPDTDGDGVGGRPTLPGGANKVVGGNRSSMSYIYHDDLASASSAAAAAAARADAAVTTVTTLQPFAATSHLSFKSPAGGMAATLGFPFTSAQWKELERQAMIYKYMLASVPVPSDLLRPITRNLSAQDPHSPLISGGSILDLQFSGNKDPEPGRCKRTDGKKWRCSRDVAPNQKYCDRHMHRGRPRSRKHVEIHAPYKKADHNTAAAATSAAVSGNKKRFNHHPMSVSNPPPQNLGSTVQPNQTQVVLHKDCDENISASCYKQAIKCLDWKMEGEMVSMDASEQQWQQLMQTDIGLPSEGSIYGGTGASCFQQAYRDEALSLLPCTDFIARGIDHRNECALYLRPGLLPLEEQPQVDTPTGFIDAWSSDTTVSNRHHNSRVDYSVSSQGNLSPSLTLSMAMAATSGIDGEMGPIAMGLGVEDSHDGYGIGGVNKSQASSWLSPAPWSASTPGGPLGEVLRPNSSAPFPYSAGGDSFGTPATTVSSPSGILQRSVLSLSDSSGCNSPTLQPRHQPPQRL